MGQARFGIKIMTYASAHEAYIKDQIAMKCNRKVLAEYHNRKIQWFQHERLVHLLVTILTAIFFMFLFTLMILQNSGLVMLLLGITLLLLTAYLVHYFRLENRIQQWYILYDEIVSETTNQDHEYNN